MWFDIGTTSQDVAVTCYPGDAYDPLSQVFSVRPPGVQYEWGLVASGPSVLFYWRAATSNATAAETGDFFNGAAEWSTIKYNCGTFYTALGTIDQSDSEPYVRVQRVESLGDLRCGAFYRREESTTYPYDRIILLKKDQLGICDNHRVETAVHEIGHLLGFNHIDSGNDLFTSPRPPTPHVIEGHHIRILTDKY